jgi:hypothetical protein
MNDDDGRLVELARNAEAFKRQLDEGGDELRRQVEQFGRAVGQFVRDNRAQGAGPVTPLPQRLMRAAEAAVREFLPPQQLPEVHVSGFRAYMSFSTVISGSASLCGTGTITASGSVALPRMSISGHKTVENPSDGRAEHGIGQVLCCLMVLIAGSGLLGVQGADRATVDHILTVISTLLPIAWFIWTMHDKQK